MLGTLYGEQPGLGVWQWIWNLREPVDVERLETAWQRVVDRHTIFRTSFHWQDLDSPRQRVWSRAELPTERLDFRELDAEAQSLALDRSLRRDRQKGVQLDQAPLLRLTTYRLEAERTVAVITFHHATIDGRSAALVLDEVFTLYDAAEPMDEVELPEPRSYRRYVEWLEERDQDAARAFWRRALEGAPEATPLVVDRPGSADSGDPEDELPKAHADHGRHASTELTQALDERAEELGVTVNTLFQGAWALLWKHYGGDDDVMFGAVRTNRSAVDEGGSIVGPMINSVPLRNRVPAGAPLDEWLQRLREHWVEMRCADFASPAEVREWTEIPSEQALFHSLLLYARGRLQTSLEARGGRWARRSFRYLRQPDAPLSLYGFGGSRLELRAIYDEEMFDAPTIDRLLGHQLHLLEQIAEADSAARLGDLSLLSEEERRQILEDWNDLREPTPESRPIHERVVETARAAPDEPAVLQGERTWSRGWLEERSRRWARSLRRAGVGPEVRLALWLPRSPERIVAALATLRAGGAYVPLDPGLPRQRLEEILRDAGVAVVITDGPLADRLPEGGFQVWEPERLDAAGDPDDDPVEDLPAVQSSHLAYVVYTSGSTGRPKGVAVTHAGLAHLVDWHERFHGLGPEDQASQIAGLGFDASVWELWPPLATGAPLHLADETTLESTAGLVRWLTTRGVTTAFVPTPLLEAAFQEEWSAEGSLRRVLTGGDALHHPPPASIPFRVFNHYGPTESTVVATVCEVAPVPTTEASAPPPIGRPIDRMEAYVAGPELDLLPVGVPGELLLAGGGLARGYLGRPDLTAEAFVPHPWSREPGRRVYRTGDRVRRRADGELEFLGRLDRQVQIRGFRVEPGEIESVLADHDQVAEAAVVVQSDGRSRLVAFWVPVDRASDAVELRRYLMDRLPEYMVPEHFEPLSEIPLTRRGKVDRRALERLAAQSVDDAVGRTLPRGPVEEGLARIWAEALELEVEEIYAESRFFDLGGDSLMALRVLSRVEETFGVRVPLERLFEAPSVAGLAESVGQIRRRDDRRPPIERLEERREPPLSFAQRRLWFLSRLEPESARYNVSRGVVLDGRLAVAALEQAFSTLAVRHETLRTSFPPDDDDRGVQRIADPRPVRLIRVDLSGLPATARADQARRLARSDARRPFDLTRPYAWRVHLLRHAPQKHDLLLTLHHLICDGWSMEVLFDELGVLARAHAAGRPAGLAEPILQYGDFAIWQRRQMGAEWLQEQLSFWEDRLAGSQPLELPTDFPRPPTKGFRGGRRRTKQAPETADAIRGLARRVGGTPFMTWLAVWAVVLGRYAGTGDVSIGIPTAGRDRRELSGLIGFFVNTVVVRVDASDDPTFDALLERVRDRCLEAWEHQDVPFERVVEATRPERTRSHNPLFQVMLTFEPKSAPTPELPETLATPRLPAADTSHFDLTLAVRQGDGEPTVELRHDLDLFTSATADRLLHHVLRVVEGAAATPEEPVSTLPWLSAGQQQQVTREWSTAPEVSAPAPVHRMFVERARETPDATALRWEGGRMSYGELEEASARLAGRLRSHGVGLEDRVALWPGAGPARATAALAVLRAGGAYVPLDPELPVQRLVFMVENVGARVMIAEGSKDEVPAALRDTGVRVLTVDGGSESDRLEPPAPDVPESLAYVIYTSGSTGRPKGVGVTHRGLANLATWHRRVYGVTTTTRASRLAGISFDASVWELWPYLTAGASVSWPAPEVRLSPTDVVRWLDAEDITHTFLATPLAEAVLSETWSGNGVRYLLTGGDRLDQRPDEGFDAALVNHYGPTENTVVATCDVVEAAAHGPRHDAAPSIGRPIDGVRTLVLNRDLRPVPPGCPGELCLGGSSLARGYLGRAGRTAASFVPNPWPTEAGDRLYRTGDRVRWTSDGRLDFLGRLDDQVQIRGFRIEPGEVAHVLKGLPDVVEAAVVAQKNGSPGGEELRLVAYVVNGESNADRLRDALRRRLPGYMVPSAFAFLDELPLTPSGKLDRRSLPEPEEPTAGSDDRDPAQWNGVEKLIAETWSEVLGLDSVGKNDNFFDLGGHSMAMVEIHGILEDELDRSIPMVELFEFPTVQDLSRYLDQQGPDDDPGGEDGDDEVRDRADRQRAARQRKRRQRKTRRRKNG